MSKVTISFAAGFVFLFVSSAHAGSATAVIKGTQIDSRIDGKVTFEDIEIGFKSVKSLKVFGYVKNAPPGKHGFHIHEIGDCGDGGKAAGGHYNPEGVPHGLLMKDGFQHAHVGDLGNIEIDSNGNGKIDVMIPGLTLKDGKYNVFGRSVILHEKEDDFGQPTGNAGGRIGCGIITDEIN